MNKLIFKTKNDIVNESVVVHIMKYDHNLNRLINLHGYEFTSITSNDKIVELDLGQDIKFKTGADNVSRVPYGAIVRIECPKGSKPVLIEDLLSFNPNKNAEIYAREFPEYLSNIESVIKNDEGFKVTLKEPQSGNLELFEIADRENQRSVLQRIVIPTSVGSSIYTFTPSTPINTASNIVAVRWTISDYSKPAGVNIVSIDNTSAPRISIDSLNLNNGILEIPITNLDSNKPFTATEADVTFTDVSGKTIVIRGAVSNSGVSGKGKITFTKYSSSKLNELGDTGVANVALIGDINNKVDYNFNLANFKSNTNGISADNTDLVFNDLGNKLTLKVKDEKNIPGSSISVTSITNEYVAGKLLYNEPVITRKSVGGHNYWEVVIDNIRTIPIKRLYDTIVEFSYNEPNKLPQIVTNKSKEIIIENNNNNNSSDSNKAMLNTKAYFNETTGNLEITMTGPYEIQDDQSYKIRDIICIYNNKEVYNHPNVEVITGNNSIKIVTNYSSNYGPIDNIKFRYSFANKIWSPIQDIECSTVYSDYIDKIVDTIKSNDFTINENNLLIATSTPLFTPVPETVIVHKLVLNNTTNIESTNINIKNRSALFKLGTLSSNGSDEEDQNGFTLKFTYNYYGKNIDITKEYRELVEAVDLDKVKTVKWSILDPDDVWGEWIEPFDNPSNPDNEGIKWYANVLRPLYKKGLNIDVYLKTHHHIRYEDNASNIVLPFIHMKDQYPLKDMNTNVCWCAKLKISRSADGYFFNNKVNDIRLKCKFNINNEEQIVYVKFKSIKVLADSIECIDPYLVDASSHPISMENYNIFADGIINGMPFIVKDKERMSAAIETIAGNSIDGYKPSYYDIKYSRWGEHKQLFPFSLVIGDVNNIDFMYQYDNLEKFYPIAYNYIKNNSIFALTKTEVGITVTPEIVFKNRQIISLNEHVFKRYNTSKYMKIDKVINIVGVTATNIITPIINKKLNKIKELDDIHKTLDVLPLNSNFTFKFSPDFKKLHFNQGVKSNDVNYMFKFNKNIEDDFFNSQDLNVTHIRINYIGKATVNNKSILDLSSEDVKKLNSFTIDSINKSSSILNPPSTGIDTANNVASGNRTKDMPIFTNKYLEFFGVQYPNRTVTNNNYPVLESMFIDINSNNHHYIGGENESYQSGKYNYNIYSYPKIYNIYNNMLNNIYAFNKLFENIIPNISTNVISPVKSFKDLTVYNNYESIKLFVNQKYTSPNLIAKPIVLVGSKGMDDTMLSDYQKIFYTQIPHLIFTTTGNINDPANKEIFNYRELKNDNHDYVIKYQVKFEDEEDFNENEFIYYLPSIAIENSLLDTYNKFTLNDIKGLHPNEYKTNMFDVIKVLENRDILTTSNEPYTIWNKTINGVDLTQYKGSNLLNVSKYNIDSTDINHPLDSNPLFYSAIRTLVVYHDEFEAIYTDKTKSPFDIAREYINTHDDNTPFVFNYKNIGSNDNFQIPLLNFDYVISNDNVSSEGDYDNYIDTFTINTLDKLILYNTFIYRAITHFCENSDIGTNLSASYIANNAHPIFFKKDSSVNNYKYIMSILNKTYIKYNSYESTIINTVDDIDITKKIKVYTEFMIPPSRTYPSITTNKTLFDHNKISIESEVINLSDLKPNIPEFSEIVNNKNFKIELKSDYLYITYKYYDGHLLDPNSSYNFNFTNVKEFIKSLLHYRYSVLDPNSKLYKYIHNQEYLEVFNNLAPLTIKIKELPGVEFTLNDINMNIFGTNNNDDNNYIAKIGRSTEYFTVPEKHRFSGDVSFHHSSALSILYDISHNQKKATIILKGKDFENEFVINSENTISDPIILTSNDVNFIQTYFWMQFDDEHNMNVDIQQDLYLAESNAKPDWIKLKFTISTQGIPEFNLEILFSKFIASEENINYPKTCIYKYKMKLDDDWYNRMLDVSSKVPENLQTIVKYIDKHLEAVKNDNRDNYITSTNNSEFRILSVIVEFSYNGGINIFDTRNQLDTYKESIITDKEYGDHYVPSDKVNNFFKFLRDTIQSKLNATS